MFELITAFIIGHVAAEAGVAGIFGGGGLVYLWHSRKQDALAKQNAIIEDQRDTALSERIKFMNQCELYERRARSLANKSRGLANKARVLERENADLKESLQLKEIETMRYKVLYQTMLQIRDYASIEKLNSEQTRIVLKSSLQGILDDVLNGVTEGKDFLIDSITGEFLADPRVLPSGHSINSSTIDEIYRSQSRPLCPFSRKELPVNSHDLPRNLALIELHDLFKSLDLFEFLKERVLASCSNENEGVNLGDERQNVSHANIAPNIDRVGFFSEHAQSAESIVRRVNESDRETRHSMR